MTKYLTITDSCWLKDKFMVMEMVILCSVWKSLLIVCIYVLENKTTHLSSMFINVISTRLVGVKQTHTYIYIYYIRSYFIIN